MLDKSLSCKLHGHDNTSSQIKSYFSPDYECVTSGSEDGYVYVWKLETFNENDNKTAFTGRRDRNSNFERFKICDVSVTCALMVKGQDAASHKFLVTCDYNGVVRIFSTGS